MSFEIVQKNVTTPLTAVQIGTGLVNSGLSICIKAKSTNTGTIGIGDSATNALLNGTTFFSLLAGQAITIHLNDIQEVWIDASVAGEGVEVLYEPSM